jgi:hypothetical protein
LDVSKIGIGRYRYPKCAKLIYLAPVPWQEENGNEMLRSHLFTTSPNPISRNKVVVV